MLGGCSPSSPRPTDSHASSDGPGRPVPGAPSPLADGAENSNAPLLRRRVPHRGDLGFEDRHFGRSEGQAGCLPYELPRCRDPEVSLEGLGILPLLEEHHPQLVLDVTVNAVQQASRLPTGTPDVRQAPAPRSDRSCPVELRRCRSRSPCQKGSEPGDHEFGVPRFGAT